MLSPWRAREAAATVAVAFVCLSSVANVDGHPEKFWNKMERGSVYGDGTAAKTCYVPPSFADDETKIMFQPVLHASDDLQCKIMGLPVDGGIVQGQDYTLKLMHHTSGMIAVGASAGSFSFPNKDTAQRECAKAGTTGITGGIGFHTPSGTETAEVVWTAPTTKGSVTIGTVEPLAPVQCPHGGCVDSRRRSMPAAPTRLLGLHCGQQPPPTLHVVCAALRCARVLRQLHGSTQVRPSPKRALHARAHADHRCRRPPCTRRHHMRAAVLPVRRDFRDDAERAGHDDHRGAHHHRPGHNHGGHDDLHHDGAAKRADMPGGNGRRVLVHAPLQGPRLRAVWAEVHKRVLRVVQRPQRHRLRVLLPLHAHNVDDHDHDDVDHDDADNHAVDKHPDDDYGHHNADHHRVPFHVRPPSNGMRVHPARELSVHVQLPCQLPRAPRRQSEVLPRLPGDVPNDLAHHHGNDDHPHDEHHPHYLGHLHHDSDKHADDHPHDDPDAHVRRQVQRRDTALLL